VFYEDNMMATLNNDRSKQNLAQINENNSTCYRGNNEHLCHTLDSALKEIAVTEQNKDASFGFVLGYN
jgi:hypothetical protein